MPTQLPARELASSDAFSRRLRALCLDRAGIDVRFLSGMPALRRRTVDLEETLATERLVVITGFALRPAAWTADAAVTRMIVPPSVLSGHPLKHLQTLRAEGARIRVSAGATRRLMILNRAVALVDLTGTPDDAEAEAVQINHPELVRLTVSHFEQLWQAAEPLAGGAPLTLECFTYRQRRVLELLAGGRTDEQVGRELGLSSRSVRTEVAAIRQILGAQSRFEAGMRYAELRRT